MTYPPGSPGYPPPQAPGGYGAGVPAAPAFGAPDSGESKLPAYLNAAVAVLGVAAYLASFGPIFTSTMTMGGISISAAFSGTGLGVNAVLLAGLLAAAGLLPKAKTHTPVVAVIAGFGALLVISQIVTKGDGRTVGWGLWLVLIFGVLQALAAVTALLLEAGVITAPAPRPKYDQFAQYGQYGLPAGGYYAQQQQQQQQHQGGQRPGYPAQYGGYPSGPTTGGFSVPGQQSAPQHTSQQGPPTPPTGFPSYGQAPAADTGQGQNADTSGPQQQQQQQQGQQQPPSTSAGPTPS